MNKKVTWAIFLTLVLFFSISSIQASDVNITNENAQVEMVNSDSSISDDYAILGDNIKNQTELAPQTDTSYGVYNVTLKDSNVNIALENKKVSLVINDVNYNATTDNNGVASFNLNINPGNYAVNARFIGDNSYEACNFTSKVNVLPTIKASDMTRYYKGSTYTATFYDSYGNVLKNRAVTINVNGKDYSKKTNNKGVASIAINLKPGTYKVVSSNYATGYRLATTIKILSTITSSDLKKIAGDSRKFKATFLKSNGKPLVNKYVKFKINGKSYKVKTNSKGQAYLALNKFKKGTYKVISYNKDGLSKTNTIKIFRFSRTKLTTSTDFYTFLSGDTKQIKIKFTTTLGGNSNSGKVIKIKVNGETYSRKTDSNGIVNFNFPSLNKGFYTFKYVYDGNKFFKPSQRIDSVTILDKAIPKLTVKSTTEFGYGAGTLLKVELTADGVPLAKRTMTFTIEGKIYIDTTDEKGIASVPIDLDIGSHTINYKTNTIYNVSGTSGSCSINVFKRSDAHLTWKCGTSFKDSSQSFKVLLTDMEGKAISGQTVMVTIDGETYYGKTGSDGYATITTYVPLGKYEVSVEALGDNKFLPSTTSKNINIKLSKFKSGINEKNHISSLGAYIKATRNCQVNNAKIKSLVNSLTKGLTDDIDKAKAIFNYVRDNIGYSYYYDTHRGATGTLSAKSGNCVDQAHLLVAMYRTAGFKARYVHGVCRFSDGVYGHVWTQVLIGNTWVVGDSINYDNALGKINNWNVNTYSLRSKYLSLPF